MVFCGLQGLFCFDNVLGLIKTRVNLMDQIKTNTQDRIVREAERKQLTGISRTTAWNLEKRGDFPKRRKLYPQGSAVCWLLSDLQVWIASRECIDLGEQNELN